MTLTLTAKWQMAETRRGITISRRVERTGTCGGNWMIPGTLFATLRQAREYVDTLPTGHFCGPGQIVMEAKYCLMCGVRFEPTARGEVACQKCLHSCKRKDGRP